MVEVIKGRLACDYGEGPLRWERESWGQDACLVCGGMKSRGAATCRPCGDVGKDKSARGRARVQLRKFLRGWERGERGGKCWKREDMEGVHW